MRIFVFLLCTTVFSFTPNNVISQNSKIKIEEDVTLTVDEIFDLIKKQTDYKFIYEEGIFDDFKAILVKKGTVRTSSLLEKSLSQGDFNLVLTKNNTILIKEKTRLQQRQISGKVSDSKGLPIPGVVIQVKGTTTGAVTDFDGNYTITVTNPENVLVFSFLGYKTQQVTVGSQSQINILMVEDVEELSEVVVTGYQQISKERSAGSVSKVDMQTIKNRSATIDLLQQMEGLIPGITFLRGGARNSQPIIRGLNSINASTVPLFVVDGIVVDGFDNLNPQDVEDITVLKDATAASIWGARAANGVIVITTKRGKFNQKMTVNYNTFYAMQGKPDVTYNKVLTGEQFIQTAKEIFNPSVFPYQTMVDAFDRRGGLSLHNQILYDLDNGLINQATADARLNALASTNNIGQIKDLYTDATLNSHTLSVQGGSEKHALYGSLAYIESKSYNPGNMSQTFKLNLRQDFKITKRIDLRLNTDLTNGVGKGIGAINADNTFYPYLLFKDANGNPLSMESIGAFSDQTRELVESNSNIDLSYVPLNDIHTSESKSTGLTARISAGLKVNLLKGLTYEGTFGITYAMGRGRSFDTEESYAVRRDRANFVTLADGELLPTEGGYLRTSNSLNKNWTVRNQFNYDNSWNNNKHQLTVLAGYEAQESFGNSKSNFIYGYIPRLLVYPIQDWVFLSSSVPDVLAPNGSGGRSSFGGSPYSEGESTTRVASVFSNMAYTFNQRYSINASFRADESNLFGIDKSAQRKPVWSVGAKWTLSKEPFMDHVSWIDQLALRTTYGITGNSPNPGSSASVDILRYRSLSPNFFNPPLSGAEISTPANRKLTWERTNNLNLGLDFSLFNNRIRGTFDYYENKTEDLIDRFTSDFLNGFSTLVGNIGDLENKGIEIGLNAVVLDGPFRWTSSIVAANNKNKITHLEIDGYNQLDVAVQGGTYIVGLPALTLHGYDFVGLTNEGYPQIRLKDGTITSQSTLGLGLLPEDGAINKGVAVPKWSGGFNNSFSYKGFTLTANAVFNLGHVMRVDNPRFEFSGLLLEGNGFTGVNVHSEFFNRWRQPGDEAFTDVPRYDSQSNRDNQTDFYYLAAKHIVSASFIKLRDITLEYALPKTVIDNLGINNLALRLQMNNVMLWKANDYDIDPEFFHGEIGRRITPTNQNSLTLGLNVSF